MPTINQLVRKRRSTKAKRVISVLGIGYNSRKRKETELNSPQKRGVVLVLER